MTSLKRWKETTNLEVSASVTSLRNKGEGRGAVGRGPSSQTDELSSIPEPHMARGESRLQQVFQPLYGHCGTPTHKINKCKKES